MSKTETPILGNGKKRGKFVNFSVNLDQIEGLIISRTKEVVKNLPSHFWENKKGDLNLKLTLIEKGEADQYGNTHFIKLDDFKPEKKS